MLTCIGCSKQRVEDGEEDGPRGTPNTKHAVKSLTTQVKGMALKTKVKPRVTNFEQGGSSTPAWHYTSTAPSRESAYTAFGGDTTPNRISSRFDDMTIGDDDGPREWIAQVEPGVQITFLSLPRGGNDLKRIRFSREMFDKIQAQRWWSDNLDRIMELYNVQKFNQQALNTPARSDYCGGRESYSNYYNNGRFPPMEAPRATTASGNEDSVSISNASEVEAEWIAQDEPGVYITLRQLVDGTRELRRVRFSREKFGEVHAKQWWDSNRDRIQAHYLS